MENKVYVTHEECYNNRKDILNQLTQNETEIKLVDKRVVVTETIMNRIDKALWFIISAVVTQTIALVFTLIKTLLV